MKKSSIVLLCLSISYLMAGKYNSVVKAFEEQPGYVQPISTLLGSFGGSGWHHSSSVSKEFTASISLPITFTAIHENDRSYSDVFVDSTVLKSDEPQHIKDELAYQPYTSPTIFGKEGAPTLKEYNVDPDSKLIYRTSEGEYSFNPYLLSDGIPDMAAFNWMPLPTIQAEFSMYYTSLKLRYLGRPHKELGIHYPGAGIQHDLRSFLPKLPLNITVFGNFALPILNWTPGEDITGTVEMRGFSTFSGMTFGFEPINSKLDLFIEAGWEYSRLSTGGHLTFYETDKKGNITLEEVNPDMTLIGRNRFRMTLTLAFTPGKRYRLSGNVGVGAETTFMVNPLAFRFSKQYKEDTETETHNKELQ